MSQKIDQFTNDLNQRLTGIEAHLKQLKGKLTTVSKEAEGTIKTKLAEARAKVDSKKEELVAAKETLAQRLETKKEEVEAEVATWKEQKEQEKLLKRAEKAEEYALAALLFAAVAAEEAEVAVLEAIDARVVADNIADIPAEIVEGEASA